MASQIPSRPAARASLPPPVVAVVTVLALAAVWATVLIESLLWIWGVIFTAWALVAISSGETFLITRLRRVDQPLLFWLVSLSWLAIGVLWVLFPS